MARRLLLALTAAVLASLCAVGAVGVGRWLLGARTASPGRVLLGDAEQLAAARLTEGYYRGHRDPEVALVLKPGGGWATHGVPFRGDDLGLRERPGAAPADDAFRVVVAGDSVAFGFGVRDDQTLAAQLEALLTDAREPGDAPVACFTAAAPGWNHRNATRFVERHWADLRPDAVVFLAVANDLSDSYAVNESGGRRAAPDLAQTDPLLVVNHESSVANRISARQRYLSGELDAPTGAVPWGPPALISDLSAESRLRYDANAASIARLARLCEANGADFTLMPFDEDSLLAAYHPVLAERVAELEPAVHVLAGFAQVPAAFCLDGNPHPNADGQGAMALWVARDLLERGVLDGDPARLPAEPELARRSRSAERGRGALRARAAAARAAARRALVTRIDPLTGEGIQQVYGGLNVDGTLGPRALAMLPAGDQLVLRVAPAEGVEPLGPVRLAVEVDGVAVGALVVASDPTVLRVALERPPVDQGVLEVRLVPDVWAMTRVAGRSVPTSVRLLSLETAADD